MKLIIRIILACLLVFIICDAAIVSYYNYKYSTSIDMGWIRYLESLKNKSVLLCCFHPPHGFNGKARIVSNDKIKMHWMDSRDCEDYVRHCMSLQRGAESAQTNKFGKYDLVVYQPAGAWDKLSLKSDMYHNDYLMRFIETLEGKLAKKPSPLVKSTWTIVKKRDSQYLVSIGCVLSRRLEDVEKVELMEGPNKPVNLGSAHYNIAYSQVKGWLFLPITEAKPFFKTVYFRLVFENGKSQILKIFRIKLGKGRKEDSGEVPFVKRELSTKAFIREYPDIQIIKRGHKGIGYVIFKSPCVTD